MELATQHPGVIAKFADLNQPAVGRKPAVNQPGFPELLAVIVVKFKAVAMAFEDNAGVLAVSLGRVGPGLHVAGIVAQPHSPALASHRALFGQKVYDRVRRFKIELGRVRLVRFKHQPGEFDDHDLHAQA